jgi:GNAT superfamily N-acetyltransferase
MLKAETLVTTYLQMRSHLEIRKPKSEIRNVDFEVRELSGHDWRFNRDMYFRVGEKWKWIDKRAWTDEQWKEYASDPKVRTFAGYYGGEVAGYFELRRNSITDQKSEISGHKEEEEVEIAYFGLLPEFVGRGLGGALLISAIENAWAWRPAPVRVWVHTCNRDHPGALANYEARGFKIYKVETLSG